MFQVIRSTNRLVQLEERRFSDLKLREREHLQEWVAHTPEALGEELLIIQKEFDGFADTRERLDLLALDKEGHLVVIENKLDDSGRDVVWQGGRATGQATVGYGNAALGEHTINGNLLPGPWVELVENPAFGGTVGVRESSCTTTCARTRRWTAARRATSTGAPWERPREPPAVRKRRERHGNRRVKPLRGSSTSFRPF